MPCRFLQNGEEDQVFDSEMEAKDAKWKSIAGLAFMNVHDPEKQSTKFDDLLLLADTALQCIKCISNKNPKKLENKDPAIILLFAGQSS